MYCGFMRSISLNFNVWIGFIPTPVPDMPLLFKSKKKQVQLSVLRGSDLFDSIFQGVE